MSEDLIEFLKSEYVPKSSIRYIQNELIDKKRGLDEVYALNDFKDDKTLERINETSALLRLVNKILEM